MPTEELSQKVFDSLRDHICVLDRSGIIILTNHAWDRFARTNGAEPARCGPGVNYLDVCRSASGRFSEGAARTADGIESGLRGASSVFTLEYPCPSPSGRAWYRVTARPLRPLRDGGVIAHADITGQALLAERLRLREAQHEAMLHNPVDTGTVVTPEGAIQFQSPDSDGVLGYRAAVLFRRNIFEFVHPEDTPAVRKFLDDCMLEPHQRHHVEYRFRDRDGAWRWLESTGRRLLASPSHRIIMNSRDMTRIRLAEKAMRDSQDALLRRREDLESLVSRLFLDQEQERRRTAAELHEKAGRQLALLILQATQLSASPDSADQLHSLQEGVGILSDQLHQLAHSLHPAMLALLGLAVALREYCEEFSRKQQVPVQYTHRGIPARLPAPITSALYRVAEEALANVARHARTRQAWVSLTRNAQGIRLSVRDAGAGFDPARLEPGSGLGILAMRERLRSVNGKLSVRARPGAGTEVVALIPLAPPGNQPRAPVSRDVIVDPFDQD